MAYGGLIFLCVIGTIILSSITSGIISGVLGEFPEVAKILQIGVGLGITIGAVYYYKYEAAKRDKAAQAAIDDKVNSELYRRQQGISAPATGGDYSMSNVFQGGVHNPFAGL